MNYKTVKSLESALQNFRDFTIYSLSQNNIDTIIISSIAPKELSQVYNIQNYI